MTAKQRQHQNQLALVPLQYKLSAAAELLSVSKRTLERMISRGDIRSTGHGKLRRVPHADLLAWIERNRQ